MTFGFSYIGLLYLVMLFVPNIIWTKNKPLDYEKKACNENKILLAFERTGEILVSGIVLIFADFNLRQWTFWCWWLVISFVLMLLYEAYWIRYFKSRKTMKDFYCSFFKVPVAGATLPVISFFLLGIYGCNFLLILSTVVLGIGHIGIHLAHEKEVSGQKKRKHIVLRIVRIVCAVIFVVIFGAISFFIGARNINYCSHYVNLIKGVEEETYVNLGNQEQYVLITGKNKKNPVIIYLHGGPGEPDTMTNYVFADFLTDDYTFIGWNQRGCGRTYFKNKKTDPENLTADFAQALKDLDELVDYACRRFNQQKVIIMGHSYGTVLGSQYVLSHADKVSAYIGIGHVISLYEGEMFSYEDALRKAEESGDDTSGLKAAASAYSADRTDLMKMQKLREEVSKYHVANVEANILIKALGAPYLGTDDIRWFMKQVGSLEEFFELDRNLLDYLDGFNIYNQNMEFEMPVLFVSGSEDWNCPAELVQRYKEAVSAPEKEMFLMNGCGHGCQYNKPAEFAATVKSFLSEIK